MILGALLKRLLAKLAEPVKLAKKGDTFPARSVARLKAFKRRWVVDLTFRCVEAPGEPSDPA